MSVDDTDTQVAQDAEVWGGDAAQGSCTGLAAGAKAPALAAEDGFDELGGSQDGSVTEVAHAALEGVTERHA
jgi:hypothetical protein